MNFSQLRIDEQLNEMWMKLSKGKMLFGDFETLYHFSKGKGTIVELGTAYGLGAVVLSLNGAKVWTVDNYQVLCTEQRDRSLDETESLRVAKALRKFLELYNDIILIKESSVNASKNFQKESIDLLYIDADHKYESLKQDFEVWFPKVKIGGYILFHDYSLINMDVRRFIDLELSVLRESKIIEEIAFKSLGESIIKIFRKLREF